MNGKGKGKGWGEKRHYSPHEALIDSIKRVVVGLMGE